MKRTAAAAAMLAALFIVSCTDWSFSYSETETAGPFCIAYDSARTECFVANYCWDGDPENMSADMTEIDGMPVCYLGGYFGRGLPMPFSVDIDESVFGENSELLLSGTAPDLPYEYELSEIRFTFSVGSGFKGVRNAAESSWYLIVGEDGEHTVYHPVIYVRYPDGRTERVID